MKRISTSATNFIRIAPLVFLVAINFFAFAGSGFRFNGEALLPIAASSIFTLGLLSIWTLRFWNVQADGEKVIVKKWGKQLEFHIQDILNIEAVPNLLSRGNPGGLNPTKIILKANHPGRKEFIYYPTGDNAEDYFLIIPWQKLRMGKAQESLKKRKARR